MARERRVLLVEDDQAAADLFLSQLRKDGVPIEHVRTGAEADRFVRTRGAVLVLIDLRLPDRAGRALIESWADDNTLGAIPIWIICDAEHDDTLWWHNVANVQRHFTKSRVGPSRMSLEIRATLGLPYADRLAGNRLAS